MRYHTYISILHSLICKTVLKSLLPDPEKEENKTFLCLRFKILANFTIKHKTKMQTKCSQLMQLKLNNRLLKIHS